MLICPVCGEPIIIREKTAVCTNGHSFDIAREGYINLLRSSKNGDRIGDDKFSARCRRDFLNKGYYSLLRDHMVSLFADQKGNLLDICCGEGYYTSAVGENKDLAVYGFDISKEMIRLGAKRGGARYFVANMAAIPVTTESFDHAIHLFAPFHESEFARILKQGGTLFSVVPGSHHLWGLKEALYDTAYLNDEKLPEPQLLKLTGTQKICGRVVLQSAEDIESVFRMTPYYFHTSAKDKEKLTGLTCLETDIEFVIGAYEKA